MFGLVDCNNFYVSCERAFNPSWNHRPVIVLSNNDGCVIARSNEAKALTIKMRVPAYQIKNEIEKFGIGVFSSNYALYGDMSNRVMSILSKYSPNQEIYSIDEAFLDLSGFELFDLKEYGEQMVKRVTKGTGIPISLGIASTKTLAKVANKFAKQYKAYKGVCIIDTEEIQIKTLQLTKFGDVWGIGRQHEKTLIARGVKTAYDFTLLPKSWVKQRMTVYGERLWKELHGEPCMELELVESPRKQICTSRTFGEMLTGIQGLKEAVSNFAAICATKLRKQKSCTASLMVFIHTNGFREDLPQYFKDCVIKLPVATNYTPDIIRYALIALERIFREGYSFKKAGVIITEVVPDNAIQGNLFHVVETGKHKKLMEVLDQVNNNGLDNQRLRLAVQDGQQPWKLKQEFPSPSYTTKLSDIITIKCKS